jgi:hypothetical protein
MVANAPTGLIGEETLTALGQSWPNDVPASTPSVISLDRSHWEPIVVHVPLRQVEHCPTYVTTVHAGSGPRASGEYPHGASIADEQATCELYDYCVEARAIVMAAIDLVAAPVRAAFHPPCSIARSSADWYEVLPMREAYDIGAWIDIQPGEAPPSP